MTEFDDQLKAGMRRLVAERGFMVQFQEPYWEGDEERVSPYGWHDSDAYYHCRPINDRYPDLNGGCGWVVPEGTKITEKTYSQFAGTFVDNRNEVGINAEGVSCRCGKYKDVTIRVTCSLGEAIQSLIGYDSTREMQL